MKTLAILAAVAIATAAAPSAAKADAMSDQKKAYQALGMHIKMQPALCKIMSKSEVERFVGSPVKDGVSAGPVAGCAWYFADGSGDGVLFTRSPRGQMDRPKDPSYKKITGVGEQAFTAHTAIGYQADALTAKGISSIIMRTKGDSTARALAMLRAVMNR